ncbi:hypothetical protein SLEP1_g21302 [Rubroshorea leprosula]|uniref:Uncharacterized protein n=1 Tax=Rubroshorea leprosula TaxID=152421 RepID=A0AAV5J5G9_9ROSI|nr:hypothetical protein SLEP1_g21302 [Rubroshorea leprosula]
MFKIVLEWDPKQNMTAGSGVHPTKKGVRLYHPIRN